MGSFTSLRDVVAALLRHWLLIITICVAGSAGSVWFALSQPRIYQATAIIQIESAKVTETLSGGGTTATLTADSQLDLIQQKMMARDNILSVINRFALFPGDIPDVERVALLRDSVTIIKLIDPALAWRTDVQPSGLSITVRLSDPTEAAAVANEFLDRILEEARRRTEGRAAVTYEFLSAEVERVGAEIATVDAELTRFKEANAASLPTSMASQRAALARLTEQRMEIEQEILTLEAESGRLRAPDLARQSALLTQQFELIEERIAATQSAIDAAPEVERQLIVFDRRLEQLQGEFTVITARLSEAAVNRQIEMRDQAERFEVLETAIVPEFPVSASRKKLAMAGGMVAGALALGLALALEIIGGRIRTAAQLEKQLGVRPVIVVPTLRGPSNLRRRRRLVTGFLLAVLAALAGYVWAGLRPGAGLPRTNALAPVPVRR